MKAFNPSSASRAIRFSIMNAEAYRYFAARSPSAGPEHPRRYSQSELATTVREHMVAVQHFGVQDELSALRRVRPRNRAVRRARVLPQPKHGPREWQRVDRPH